MMALLLLALALAMDALAVSMAHGAAHRPGLRDALRIGATLGLAQALMPLLGWALGRLFAGAIEAIDHWIALVLLAGIGIKMIYDSVTEDDPDEAEDAAKLSGIGLLLVAIATSIDAAAAGVTLPTLGLPVGPAVATIGLVTAVLCAAGTLLGARIGDRFGRVAGIGGGIVLIGLGAWIFAEHSGWLG
jgi:putative Mn2+ efflux pump MntP